MGVFRRNVPDTAPAAEDTGAVPKAGDTESSSSEEPKHANSNESLEAFHASKPNGVYKVPVVELGTAKEHLLGTTKKAYSDTKTRWSTRAREYTILDWASFVLPCVGWLRTYHWRTWLWHDILAGLSVGSMVIPQGMSYAGLAGVPAVYGLYGAFVPVWVYSGLGSSRQLAVGPVAVTSQLIYTSINNNIFRNPNDNFNAPSDPEAQMLYNKITIQLAFLVGIYYTAFGLLCVVLGRLGWLTNFLSHAVISGFTSGAVITIGFSQAKFIFGYNRWYQPWEVPVCVGTSCVCPNGLKYDKAQTQCYESFPRTDAIYESIGNLISWKSQFQWREFVMSIAWLFLLLSFRFLGTRFSRLRILKAIGPFTVLVISIAITSIFKLYKPPYNIRVVGYIPKGLPGWTGNWIGEGFYDLRGTALLAALVCLIDVMESIAIATTLANKNRYQLNYTQELRGLGIANLVGSLFNCYSTTGSFSRSAVNDSVGAKSCLAQFVSGLLVMLVLLLITPAFKNLPQNAMACIIMAALVALFDIRSPIKYFRLSKLDCFVWLVAFFVVIFVSVEIGLITSIILSLVLVLFRVAFPHAAELGMLPNSNICRNIKQYPEAELFPGICIVRLDAPVYFANMRPMRERIQKYERNAIVRSQQAGVQLRFTILDFSPVTDMDGPAVHWMEEIIHDHRLRNVKLIIANPSKKIMTMFARARLGQELGDDGVFVRIGDACEYAQGVIKAELAAAKQEQV